MTDQPAVTPERIQRYSQRRHEQAMDPNDVGSWVRYRDHIAAIAIRDARIVNLERDVFAENRAHWTEVEHKEAEARIAELTEDKLRMMTENAKSLMARCRVMELEVEQKQTALREAGLACLNLLRAAGHWKAAAKLEVALAREDTP